MLYVRTTDRAAFFLCTPNLIDLVVCVYIKQLVACSCEHYLFSYFRMVELKKKQMNCIHFTYIINTLIIQCGRRILVFQRNPSAFESLVVSTVIICLITENGGDEIEIFSPLFLTGDPAVLHPQYTQNI